MTRNIPLNFKMAALFLFFQDENCRLEEFLKSSEVFYKYQFGFRKHYSTNHVLISNVEKIHDALDKNMYTCGVFIGLEKVFDTVNHQILISKLYHLV